MINIIPVCDSCIDSAIYNDGADEMIAETVCVDMGAEISDHICESTNTGVFCDCACH